MLLLLRQRCYLGVHSADLSTPLAWHVRNGVRTPASGTIGTNISLIIDGTPLPLRRVEQFAKDVQLGLCRVMSSNYIMTWQQLPGESDELESHGTLLLMP
jgi:hypothetical protein